MSTIRPRRYRRRRTRKRGTWERFWILRKARSRSQPRPCSEAIRIARRNCREKQTRPSWPLSGDLNGGPPRKGKARVGDMNDGPVSVELKYGVPGVLVTSGIALLALSTINAALFSVGISLLL